MADLMKVEGKAIALNGYLNGVKDATAKFMDIINGVKFMYSESPDYPASDHTADVAKSLSGLDVTALNKFADALRGMNDSAKAYVAGKNTADELHDKCQTCVNKVSTRMMCHVVIVIRRVKQVDMRDQTAKDGSYTW